MHRRALVLVGVGGALGALGRWGVARALPTDPGGFPWATLIVNVVGCLLIGAAARRVRPATDTWFLGVTGAIGGFTTFSTFANEVRTLVADGHGGLGVLYLGVTLAAGLAAVEVGRGVAR